MGKLKWLWRFGLILAIAAGAFYLYQYLNPTVVTVFFDPAVDVRNDYKLSGFADNIFVGQVLANSGSKKQFSYPETQFQVQVLENIKGELNGVVIVNQQGGKEGTKLFLFDGDVLVQSGKKYVFVTTYQESENWHTLFPAYGNIEVKNDEELSKLTERFREAYRNEVPFDFGIGPGTDGR